MKIGRKPIINKFRSLIIRKFIAAKINNGRKVTNNSIIAGTQIDISRTVNNFLIKE